MKYSYDLLKADSLERLVFLMNTDGQRGYKLVDKIHATSHYDDELDDFTYEYSCLMERADEDSAIEAKEVLKENYDDILQKVKREYEYTQHVEEAKRKELEKVNYMLFAPWWRKLLDKLKGVDKS